MSKLTEIKEAMKEVTPGPWEWQQDIRELKGETEKVMICSYELVPRVADAEIIAKAPEYITYLLSLLEEKDKALAFYAEYDNHKWKVEVGDYFMTKYTNVTQDYGNIARKALNTSSNSEGE